MREKNAVKYKPYAKQSQKMHKSTMRFKTSQHVQINNHKGNLT